MTQPTGEVPVPVSVRQELSYTTARSLGAGALAIGAVDYQPEEGEPRVLMDLVEVTEPGVGRYATSDEAEALRNSDHGKDGKLVGTPAMWGAFVEGAKAGDFDQVIGSSSGDI